MPSQRRRHLPPALAALSLLAWMAAPAAADPPATSAAPGALRVYVGTYTSGTSTSKGIYRMRLDLATGALTSEGEPTSSVNPSFLALHPSGRFLYAVNELGESRADKSGGVSAYAVDRETGDLRFLNRRPSGGAAPCHLFLDAAGRHLLVSNYWGGSVSIFPVEADGSLGRASGFVQHEGKSPSPREDMGPHAHSAVLDAANRFAVVADLGLDKLFVYRYDTAKGRFGREAREVPLPLGAGPRHFAFAPDGRHGYLIDELNSTIAAFEYRAATGLLTEIQIVSTKPAGFTKHNDGAEIAVSADGRFLYGSNRGHDSIVIFAIDRKSGRLSRVGFQSTRGHTPRNFALDPTGRFLLAANKDSDQVAVFRIDPARGTLTPVGQPVAVPRPVCILMTAASPGSLESPR